MSQHEDNNGTEYVVLNGVLLEDKDDIFEYSRKIVQGTDDFKVMYSDEYLTISQKDNRILFYSHYENKDKVGRKIHYMYLLDKQDNLERVLDYLEKDSMALNRQFDRERTMEIIQKIKSNDTLKTNLAKWILTGIGLLGLLGILYLISKLLGNNE